MDTKNRIFENLVDKILGKNRPKRKFAVYFDGMRAHKITLSAHKSKQGRKYAQFLRVRFCKKSVN